MDRLTLQVIKDLFVLNGISVLGVVGDYNEENLNGIADKIIRLYNGTLQIEASCDLVWVMDDFFGQHSDDKKIQALQDKCSLFLVSADLTHPFCLKNFDIKNWVGVDLTAEKPITLFVKRGCKWGELKISTRYGKRFRWQRSINAQKEEPLRLVTLMDFPDDEKYNLLCMIWLKYARKNAPASPITILTSRGISRAIQKYLEQSENVEVRQAQVKPLQHFDHYNLAVKLYNLANLDFPFLFLDADAILLSAPSYLWDRRHYKPWIGVDDQTSQLRLCAPFSHLNSGMQLVSDPVFYNYDLIVKRFQAGGYKFICNGMDQPLIFDYFRALGYDYRHPEINAGWNCCSRYCRLYKDESGRWRGITRDFPEKYEVSVVHYWNGSCRPWNLKCPLYAEEQEIFKKKGIKLKIEVPSILNSSTQCKVDKEEKNLKVKVMNSAVDLLKLNGASPLAPAKEMQIEVVDSPGDADIIYWHMDIDDPKLDYKKLVYSNGGLFKEYQEKFLLFVPSRTAGILYLNNAISLTPYPVYDAETNALSRVFSIPYMLDCVDIELVMDKIFFEECRSMKKNFDLCYAKALKQLVESGILKTGSLKLCEIDVYKEQLKAMQKEERINYLRGIFRQIASSSFYFHHHAEGKVPLLLYIAMLLGTVPLVVGLNDLPYHTEVDWNSFATFPRNNFYIDDLLLLEKERYDSKRNVAINFALDYCALPEANDKVLRFVKKLLKPD
jgi:hypothetical protein